MKYERLTREGQLQEIRRLWKNLKRRTANITAAGGDLPTTAVDAVNELKRTLPPTFAEMSDADLTKTLRQMRYIDQLKGSSVRGAKEVRARWTPIQNRLDDMSEEQRNDVWAIYSDLYNYNPTLQRFRYEIINMIIDKQFAGYTRSQTYEEIKKMYTDAEREAYETGTDITFTNSEIVKPRSTRKR